MEQNVQVAFGAGMGLFAIGVFFLILLLRGDRPEPVKALEEGEHNQFISELVDSILFMIVGLFIAGLAVWKHFHS